MVAYAIDYIKITASQNCINQEVHALGFVQPGFIAPILI